MTTTTPGPVPGRTRRKRNAVAPGLLLRREDAAALCSVGLTTWDRWTTTEANPAPVVVDRVRLWRRAELLAWVDAGCPGRAAWSPHWAETAAVAQTRK